MRTGTVILALCCLLLAASGCSDNGPTGPSQPLPDDASAAADAFVAAFSERDSTLCQALLTPDFQFKAGRNESVLGTEGLSREQFLRAVANMCVGDPAVQPCVIDSIGSSTAGDDDWETVPEGWDFSNFLRRRYSVHFDIVRPGCFDVPIYGDLVFYVEELTGDRRDQAGPYYQLCGIEDYTWSNTAKIESYSISELLEMYLAAGLPHARLLIEDDHGTTETVFSLDAGESWCGGLGLPPAPYRWQIGEDAEWSGWTSEPLREVTFTKPGENIVTLEVRNSEGWTSRSRIEFYIVAAVPGNMAELLTTFDYAHDSMDASLLIQCLSPEFRFVLHEDDVEAFGLSVDHLDFAAMVGAVVNMFSGSPAPGGPPMIERIDFNWIMWYDDRVYIRVYRPLADYLFVESAVELVVSTTILQAGDGRQEHWVFDSITDLTGPSSTGGDMSWGALLLTYR